jgi:hypothetical protein
LIKRFLVPRRQAPGGDQTGSLSDSVLSFL